MHGDTVVIFLALVVLQVDAKQQIAEDVGAEQGSRQKLGDAFAKHVLQARLSRLTDLDKTSLGKPCSLATRTGNSYKPTFPHWRALSFNRHQDAHCCHSVAGGDRDLLDKLQEPGLYEALGFASGEEGSKASIDEIKIAYRKAAKECHPDAGGSESQFRKVSEAYELLSNDELRAAYNEGSAVIGSAIAGASEDRNPFTYPDEIAEHVFVDDWRVTAGDVQDALEQAPDYFQKTERGTIRYSAVGPVSKNDIRRVFALTSRSFSGCFHWVTGAQLALLIQMQQPAIDGFDDPQAAAYEIDSWLAKAEFENNRYIPPEERPRDYRGKT